MFKTAPLFLALLTTAFTAEISSSYAMIEKQAAFKPELKTEPVETHVMKEVQKEGPVAEHPVYTANVRNQGRARIEPVRSLGPVISHSAMLSDQPPVSADVNRNDEIPNGYVPSMDDVTYPDIPYAPGYLYDNGYSASNNYDMYGPNNYLMEPDTSTLGLLWSQVPNARTMVGFVGRTIGWILNSILVLIVGSLLTVGVCTYTNMCTIAFHGVGPIHEEMRALMSPNGLQKISHAADFVKTAIDKYQTIQKVTESTGMRKRRAIFK